MLQSKTILRALGQSFVANIRRYSAFKTKPDEVIQDETYEEFGRYYWAKHHGEDTTFSLKALIDFVNHSSVICVALETTRKNNPGKDDAAIIKILFNETLSSQCCSNTEIQNYMIDPKQKRQKKQVSNSVRNFLYPCVIMMGAYQYLPDSVHMKPIFATTATNLSTVIEGNKVPGLLTLDTYFKTYVNSNIMALEATLMLCPKDLETIDKQFLLKENLQKLNKKWLESYDASTCIHCLLSVFPKQPHKTNEQTVNGNHSHSFKTKK